MNANPTHYDVIIVGGRPAGATLAVRLGREGLRVLLLERVAFPCPHPASSPIIYASAMSLLDEIGAVESDYAENTPRTTRWINEFYDQFRSYVPVPKAFGRNYGYAIDRAHFDDVLWRMAASLPNVTTRQPFSVTDLLWQDDRVIGITGHAPDAPPENFTANWVIGADGRFSTVAQKANAKSLDIHSKNPTTIYYATWENVDPFDADGAVVHFCKPSNGYFLFLFDTANGLVNVNIEGKSELFSPGPGQVDHFYMDIIRRHPLVWRRLSHAQRIGPVKGMRNIGNFYRTAGGNGWALVGDALHQKDPIDGQGIYDALFSAKVLSQEIIVWKTQSKPWERVIADYDAAVRAETYPMYKETIGQVKQNIYSNVHPLMYRLIGLDDELNHRYALLTVRAIPPKNWLPANLLLQAVGRGIVENIGYAIARKPHPAEIRA